MATVVAFHAHPDDEVLMTGGTLARAAAEGHRVVIVVATDGATDAVGQGEPPRLGELRASAAVLGAARVVHLGYADSGNGAVVNPDPPDRVRFTRADPQEAAARLAGIIQEEKAQVLLSYDANGGYGHRDHVRVHEVGRRAASLAGVEQVLEATIPRDLVVRVLKLVDWLRLPIRHDAVAPSTAYSSRSVITHRVNVRKFAKQKQAALAAHQSQVNGTGRLAPIMRALIRLPTPLFGLLLGREWFISPPELGSTKHSGLFRDSG
ncbi:PIG-L family deacetylase [Streptomyces violaceochromogenes]|uniref:PIG-L family deacetylase n=1 Tax=Streptomyces violaceochromogenes TaxID=67377 RepID=A0ABU6M796_9ACTN|nr:PIG-L family deacetylase [Streptomyces violaceochromogenes]MEC7056692.1 PIG-L family deacetylase [Streptomyces violaceochromogenes]GHC65734.1 GlcNAc-PI de-N-acetylase [Streptomyces violaceochromogenes]